MKIAKQTSYRPKMREQMLEIATRIVATEGLAALQARRIAHDAGCAVGTLYNVFGGLDLLIIEANANTLTALGKDLAQANSGVTQAPIRDRLMALALAYLDFASTHNKAWRAIFEHQMSPDAQVPAWYRDRQGELFGLVETILTPANADPKSRAINARALFAAVHGIVAISLDSKLGDFNYAETQTQIRFVVGAVADGIAHGPAI
jgi:AcrR family transcriptional regulator